MWGVETLINAAAIDIYFKQAGKAVNPIHLWAIRGPHGRLASEDAL